ncbi:MAG: Calx-beta domain-containing protein [Limisphaerales bacterium]
MLVIGGAFSQYDGQSHGNIARIYGGSLTGSGAFEFTSANFSVHESGTVAAVTIRRTGGTSGTNISVHFATSDSSAKNGTNYLAVSTDINFLAGEVLKTILVPVLDDLTITPSLTANMTLSDPTLPATIGNQPTATLTILNDDSAVSFSSAFYSQAKNALTGMAVIDVIRSGGTNGTASVDFFTSTNGTAVAGIDYYPTNLTVMFHPGESDVQVQIPIINNGLPEGNTTVGLQLTNAIGTLLYSPSNAILTIIDTTPSPGRISFSSTNYVVNEGDGTASLTVVRTNGSSGSVSVSYATIPGTAQPAINYTPVSGTLTFGNGEIVKAITVPLADNNLVQGTVSLSVLLSNPTGGALLIDPTNATLTILDNDFGVAFVNATNYVSETNSIGTIFVQKIGSASAAFQVNYSTTNGTAVAGVNYQATAGTLAFADGEMLKTISVPLIYRPQVNGDLTFGMALTAPTAGARLAVPSNAVVVVQDGDAGLSFTNTAINVLKNAGNAIITVVCSNPGIEPVASSNSIPLSVHYSTANGSALAGIHYTAVSGTLIFTNGIATNTFSVPIINNGVVDSNRTFTVTLSSPTAPGKLVPPVTQTVTIVEANNGFRFSSPAYTILRSGIATNITILRTGNTDTVAAVSFIATNGTAIAGTDYISTNGTFIFTNGVTSKTFSVAVIANSTVQPDKTVLLQLFSPSNSILIPPNAATLTIHDTSGSLVVPAGSALTSESFAPANGIIDPGENVSLLFAFRASGGTNVLNLSATLLATNGVMSPSPASQNYGALVVSGPSVSRPFSFTANGTNGQLIAATFQLKSGTNSLGTAIFTYTLGTWATIFTNTNTIVINDATTASPYPSLINVNGVGGTLIKATVTLTNISHATPSDIDVLLVAPNQQDTLLMGHAGGGNSLNRVTLTFDDAASNSLPHFTPITSGTNKPTAYLPVPNFP